MEKLDPKPEPSATTEAIRVELAGAAEDAALAAVGLVSSTS
jgi:hypothetical protein